MTHSHAMLTECYQRLGIRSLLRSRNLVPELEWSTRLRRSLAITYPARSLIRINAILANPPNVQYLKEVIVHEVAHLLAYDMVGTAQPPHGPLWQSIVRENGYQPKLKLRLNEFGDLAHLKEGETAKYVHKCPICQNQRVAKRRMRRWRCDECLTLGLDGELEITKWESTL